MDPADTLIWPVFYGTLSTHSTFSQPKTTTIFTVSFSLPLSMHTWRSSWRRFRPDFSPSTCSFSMTGFRLSSGVQFLRDLIRLQSQSGGSDEILLRSDPVSGESHVASGEWRRAARLRPYPAAPAPQVETGHSDDTDLGPPSKNSVGQVGVWSAKRASAGRLFQRPRCHLPPSANGWTGSNHYLLNYDDVNDDNTTKNTWR